MDQDLPSYMQDERGPQQLYQYGSYGEESLKVFQNFVKEELVIPFSDQGLLGKQVPAFQSEEIDQFVLKAKKEVLDLESEE